MRIANNRVGLKIASPSVIPVLILGMTFALASHFVAGAYAAEPMPSTPSLPAAPVMAPSGAPNAAPSLSMPGTTTIIDPTASLSGSSDATKSGNADISKTTSAMEDKLSESAKGLVKRLDKTSDPMTMEDMNEARQTAVRIDAMIDIEKRLAELDKLRKDRNGEGSSSSFAGAIPASALNPTSHMPSMPSLPMLSSSEEQPVFHRPMSSASSLEIARIIGTEGRYTAVLKLADGDLKSVRVGDQVSPDVTVQGIASSSVVLDENGKTHTLHIKNVDVIYSAMR